jgi:hypothetical protein
MSLKDQKRNVFTTIGAYTSFMETPNLPEQTDIFTSVNNTKNDVVAFLMDVIKSIVGTDGLQNVVGKLLTDFVDNAEPELKTAIRNQFIQYNAGDNIPAAFVSGIRVPVSKIDTFGKFKTSGNATVDDLLHGNNTSTFNKQAYNAIVNAGTDVIYNNLAIKYDSSTDEFIFKRNPAVASQNQTIGAWMGNYIDDAVVINKKDFLTDTLNAVYGTITANQKKSVEEVYQELQVAKLIEFLIDGNDNIELTQQDFDELLQKAQDMVNGIIYYDMGCGMVGATLSLSGFTDFINTVSGTTDSFVAGNAAAETINESMSANPDIASENSQSIKDGFFRRLIRAITAAITYACATSPQIKALQAIMGFFETGSVQLENPTKDIENYRVFIKCIVKAAIKMISRFIYGIAIALLVAWLKPVIKKIAQEKIIQYTGTIKSLT